MDPLNGARWSVVQGDCLELLRGLPDGCIDAVVTDPPYGIGQDGRKKKRRVVNRRKGGKRAYHFGGWDTERPCPDAFSEMLRVSAQQIIWGGNYFADLLPPTAGWLVWDKGQKLSQADGELAWTSRSGALRICLVNRTEILVDGAVHPTQKPIELMMWCIQQLRLPSGSLILDPYCGSGSTGVAAMRLGMRFLGFELDRDKDGNPLGYIDIARRRIAEAAAQESLPLFDAPQAPTPKDAGQIAMEGLL